MSQPGSTSHVSPLAMTYMAAATDCYSSLGLGFGTAGPGRRVNLEMDMVGKYVVRALELRRQDP